LDSGSELELDTELGDESDDESDVPEHGIQRLKVRLKALPQPDVLERSLPAGRVALMTSDGTPTTVSLARSLLQKGWQVVVLKFPTAVVHERSPLPSDLPQIQMQECSEAHLTQALQQITAHFGAIGAFLHLHPAPSSSSPVLQFSPAEKTLVKQVFFLAKHLKASLTQSATAGHASFHTITRLDGAFGFERTVTFSAIAAGLVGLTKTLNMEWPAVQCRAIDLHPDLDPQAATQAILGELFDPNQLLTEVAHGRQGRVTVVAGA
jgi:NAD(P)-dependent dehydrogenase (short-subunit alcohol dehydrogenase family)